MAFFDFGTIFFLIAAVVIFFQLRNVLGRRTGNERPPFDPYTAARTRDKQEAPAGGDGVVALPRKRAPGEAAPDAYGAIDAYAKPETDLNKGLRAIRDADPSFDPKTFIDGAKMAYEMIVMSYADGDRKTLKNLLSRDVYDGFVAAIADRGNARQDGRIDCQHLEKQVARQPAGAPRRQIQRGLRQRQRIACVGEARNQPPLDQLAQQRAKERSGGGNREKARETDGPFDPARDATSLSAARSTSAGSGAARMAGKRPCSGWAHRSLASTSCFCTS